MSADDLMARVSATLPGSRARVVVHRDGRTRTVEVEVEELPLAITTREELRSEDSANFGLSLGDSRDGSFVRRVEDDSPASEAGIQEGDIVRKVNQRIVHTAAEATRELQRVQVGRPTFVIVWRGGRETLIEMQRD